MGGLEKWGVGWGACSERAISPYAPATVNKNMALNVMENWVGSAGKVVGCRPTGPLLFMPGLWGIGV